jgi:hypothetical protein
VLLLTLPPPPPDSRTFNRVLLSDSSLIPWHFTVTSFQSPNSLLASSSKILHQSLYFHLLLKRYGRRILFTISSWGVWIWNLVCFLSLLNSEAVLIYLHHLWWSYLCQNLFSPLLEYYLHHDSWKLTLWSCFSWAQRDHCEWLNASFSCSACKTQTHQSLRRIAGHELLCLACIFEMLQLQNFCQTLKLWGCKISCSLLI